MFTFRINIRKPTSMLSILVNSYFAFLNIIKTAESFFYLYLPLAYALMRITALVNITICLKTGQKNLVYTNGSSSFHIRNISPYRQSVSRLFGHLEYKIIVCAPNLQNIYLSLAIFFLKMFRNNRQSYVRFHQ